MYPKELKIGQNLIILSTFKKKSSAALFKIMVLLLKNVDIYPNISQKKKIKIYGEKTTKLCEIEYFDRLKKIIYRAFFEILFFSQVSHNYL